MKHFFALSLLVSGLSSIVLGLAVQSGPESGYDSVAGGMNFDPSRNVLYVTGATDGSFFGDKDPSATNCFLATIDLADAESLWSSRRQLGNADVAESCSQLLRMEDKDKLFIAGAALEGGILSELRSRGSLKATVYGMIMQLNLAAANADNAFALEGGHLMHVSHVQYPISMDRDTEYLYVASIISEDVTQNKYYKPFVRQSYKYGSKFQALVQRYAMTEPFAGDASFQQTLLPSWHREIGTSSDVFVAGLLYMSGSSLVLAGATVGGDNAFPDTTPGNDFDGFVTEINPASGVLTSKSYRIQSQPGREDRVYAACKQEGGETSFYVVGVTTGNLVDNVERNPSEQAFIMKLQIVDSRGFSMEWVRQVGAEAAGGSAGVQGLACAVTSDGNDVYMVGRVDANASLSGPDYQSAGGTDVFVVQLETEQGNVNYLRQFGSTKDDYVSDVVTDSSGNALIYGTTNGSLYRSNDGGEQDIFLLSFSRTDGTFEAPITDTTVDDGPGTGATPTGPATDTPNASPVPPPTDAATPPTEGPASSENPDGAGNVDSPDGGSNVAAANNQVDSGGGVKKGGKIAITVIILSIVALAGFFVYRRIHFGKDLYYSDEDHVVEYLKGFDDVEVDLKHSATGGWHGTYLNPRYQSSDNYSYNSETTGASIRFVGNSSYVRDSLFMDDYDAPSLGSHEDEMSDEREGLTRQRSNYDGLLDAYNTTWDDLSPHVMPTTRPVSKRDLSDTKHVMETIDFMKDDDAWGKEII